MRRDYCEKDGFSITYTDRDVCFEEPATAQALVVANDGTLLINNFDAATTEFLIEWYHKIYRTIVSFRTMDRMEDAG